MPASADLASLVNTLRNKASIAADEALSNDPSILMELVSDAVRLHNETYITEAGVVSVPIREVLPVTLFAWAEVCLARASQKANEASITGASGIGSDRNTPFDKNMRMYKELMARYLAACGALKLTNYYSPDARPEIASATVESLDFGGASSPVSLSIVPPVPQVASTPTTAVSGDGTLRVNWDLWDNSNFAAHILLHDTGATSILDAANYDAPTGIPAVNNTCTIVARITDPTRVAVKVQNLTVTQGTVNRFVVARMSLSGKYSYSAELVLTQP